MVMWAKKIYEYRVNLVWNSVSYSSLAITLHFRVHVKPKKIKKGQNLCQDFNHVFRQIERSTFSIGPIDRCLLYRKGWQIQIFELSRNRRRQKILQQGKNCSGDNCLRRVISSSDLLLLCIPGTESKGKSANTTPDLFLTTP